MKMMLQAKENPFLPGMSQLKEWVFVLYQWGLIQFFDF